MADLLVVVFLGFASFGSPCTLGGPTLGGLGDRLLRLGDECRVGRRPHADAAPVTPVAGVGLPGDPVRAEPFDGSGQVGVTGMQQLPSVGDRGLAASSSRSAYAC